MPADFQIQTVRTNARKSSMDVRKGLSSGFYNVFATFNKEISCKAIVESEVMCWRVQRRERMLG